MKSFSLIKPNEKPKCYIAHKNFSYNTSERIIIIAHATVAFTLDIYAHYTEDLRKESSEKMENFISRLSDITLPVVSSKVS